METQTQRAGNPLSTGFIRNSSFDEIKGVLKHIAFLIGLPDYKKPDADMIIPYMQQKWGHITLKEITTAFESAAENLFVDLSLDGKTFNPAFMRQVILSHREYNGKQRRIPEGSQTNKQQVGNIIKILAKEDPALLEDLKKIGNRKYMTSPETKVQDDIYQQLMREFDKLYYDQFDPDKKTAIRAVRYGDKLLPIESYIKVRLGEINKEKGIK